MPILGRELKAARARMGLKQQDISRITGVTQKYLSRVENDKADPSFSLVVRLASVLRMDLNMFLHQETERHDLLPRPSTPREVQEQSV